MAARAREANAEFKIDPVPGLTGVFGQIRKTRQIDGNFGNGSDEEDGSKTIFLKLNLKVSKSDFNLFSTSMIILIYSEVSSKHGVFLILFEKIYPTACLIRTSTFINF